MQKLLVSHEEAYERAFGRRGSCWLVTPADHELGHHNVAASSANLRQLYQLVLQLLMSALGLDPAMFGWSMSTTETYAGVVFNLMVRESLQYQRVVKRRMERTYRLALAGISAEVSLRWKGQPDLKPQEAAQAQQAKAHIVWGNLERGIISPDQAAQELGYEKAFDPKRAAQPQAGQQPAGAQHSVVRLVLSLDRTTGGYTPARLTLVKGPDGEDLATEQAVQAEAEVWAKRYRDKIAPTASGIQAKAVGAAIDLLSASRALSEAEFVGSVYQVLAQESAQGWAEKEAVAAVRDAVEPVYRSYRLLSTLATGDKRSWTWGAPEQRALECATRADSFYFGKAITNADAQAQALSFLREQYLDKGAALFEGQDSASLAAFRQKLGEALADLSDKEVARIVDTSVQRLHNWSAIQQLAEAEAAYAQIWAILDARTSAICREMHGRVIKVADAAAEVEQLSSMSADEFAAHLRAGTPVDATTVRLGGTEALAAAGKLLPPYHPRCRTRVKMSLSKSRMAASPEGLNEDQGRAWRYWQDMGPTAQQARLADAADAEFRIGKISRHANKHPEVAATVEGYTQAARDLLAAPEKVLLRMDSSGNYQLGLMSGGENDWVVAIIDPDDRVGGPLGPPRLATMYGPSPQRPTTWTKRADQLARNDGWVEVTS